MILGITGHGEQTLRRTLILPLIITPLNISLRLYHSRVTNGSLLDGLWRALDQNLTYMSVAVGCYILLYLVSTVICCLHVVIINI